METSRDHRRIALAVIASGNFMVQLAMMPISTILPTVAHSFGVAPDSVAWVMTAYLLTLSGIVLTSGRLGDMYGHRRMFVYGAALFAVSAAIAGASGNLLAIIVARAIQGLGAGLMMGNALALLVHYVPQGQRGRGIGITAIASSVGSLVGVVMASFLLDIVGWRSVFLIAAPAGLITMAIALRLPPDRVAAQHRVRPDIAGAVILFLMLTCLSLSMTHLHDGAASFEAGWPYHTTMQIVTGILLIALLVTEARARNPMMPLALFRHRRFTMAILANGTLHMTMMGSMFLVPFLVEQGLNRPPSTTGAILIPMQLTSIAASFFSGWLYDRTRSRLMAPIALVVIGCGMGILGMFGLILAEPGLIVILMIVGVATNTFMTANNTAVMSSLPSNLSGFSAGMLETSRQLGHSVAVGLAAGVLGLVAEHTATANSTGLALTLAIQSFALVAFVGTAFAIAAGGPLAQSRAAAATQGSAD